MSKEFTIPVLDDKSWKGLQADLKLIHDYASNIEKLIIGEGSFEKRADELTPDEKIITAYIEKIHVVLGLIDHTLGREYTAEEAIAELRKRFEEKNK